MSYIGNPIITQAFLTDQFSGNGSTTVFTMSVAPANTAAVLVAVSGVVQDPTTYAVFGTTLTFSVAPPSGTANISCRYLGIPASGVATTAYRTKTEFTATAGQTTFTPPSYNVGFIDVYLNGVLLASTDYTASNGTTVVLATGAAAGNIVTVDSFRIESVANAISNSAGAINLAGTLISGTLPVANGGTGVTSLTANNVLLGNGTSALQVVAPSTSGNLLTSNGTTWVSSAPAAAGLSTKKIQVSRDMTLASGNQAITGVGFRPTAAIIFSAVQSSNRMSATVLDSAGSSQGVKDDSANIADNWTNINSISDMGSGNEQIAAFVSYDADGMTISWTKYGSPTGTAYLNILFMK